MLAGNLEGQTQTLHLAIYTTLESDLRAARALSIVFTGTRRELAEQPASRFVEELVASATNRID